MSEEYKCCLEEIPDAIYTIAVCTKLELNKHGRLNLGASRFIGFYFNADMARNAVKCNMCDIHEYTYDYAIIEKYEEGCYGVVPYGVEFYKYNEDIEQYEKIESPVWADNFFGYTTGV